MDDFPNLLHRDYGLKPQGKSAPMTSSSQRNVGPGHTGGSVYDDVFGGPPKFTGQSFQDGGAGGGYDDIFRSYSAPIKNSSVPVFEAPVYDDDIFGGLKGVRNPGVTYDDVFSGGSVAPIGDLLEENSNLGQRSGGGNRGGGGPSSAFDDLIPGFTSDKTRSAGENRPKHRVSTPPQKPEEDSFVVLEPDLSSNSSSTLFSNPLEQLNIPPQPASTKNSKVPSNGTKGIDGINTLDGYPLTGRAASSPMNKSRVAKSPLKVSHSNTPHRSGNSESVEGKAAKKNSMISNFVRDHSKPPASSKFSSPRRHRQPLHENSTYVSDLSTRGLSPSKKSEKVTNAVTERLVSVDEIKLRTRPTTLPPPSRPPPRLVIKQGPSSNKMIDSHSALNSNRLTTRQVQSGKASKYASIQELEDFASGESRVQLEGNQPSLLMDGMVEGSSAAAASTAAMQEAMERAEAKLKLVKEARERTRGDWEIEPKMAKPQEKERQNRRDERTTQDVREKEEREGALKAAQEARQQEEKEKAAKAAREARQREEKEKAAKAAREAREREPKEAAAKAAREAREREAKEAATKAAREVRERESKEAAAKAAREAREREEREREEQGRERRQKARDNERERERERDLEREREREKDRIAVERATKQARERAERAAVERAAAEARERAAAEAREKAERAAFERAAAEARDRAAAEAKERAAAERAAAERAAAEKAAAVVRDRAAVERAVEARLRAERAASERVIAEARERAAERAAVERVAAEARERAERAVAERAAAAARERQRRNENDLESFFGMGVRPESAPRQRPATPDATSDVQSSNKGFSGEVFRKATAGTPQSFNRSNLSTNMADDWTSLLNPTSSEEFQEIPGESAERRRARLERHQRTRERAAKALAEKNDRDLQVQRDQAERHRLAETLDADVKRWATGKEGNLRALLSTLQYILWPESGWQPVSLTDIITGAAVKKIYRKATLCVHPDKVQQKGATIQQKYVAEKVFDLLKEAWNKFNSEELF